MEKKRQSFVLTAVPEDLGEMQYGFGRGGKTDKDKTGERKKIWRSPAAIYLYAVAAFFVFWFLYTVIGEAVRDGAQTILRHGVDLFALAVCLLIIIVSVCKLWGKFGRFALRHNLVKNSERASVEDSVEMMEEAYEKLEKEPPVFEVYENYIRATDGEVVKIFDRAYLEKIIAYKTHGVCLINLVFRGEYSSDVVVLKGWRLPLREANRLKTIFGDTVSIEPLCLPTDDGTKSSRWRENLDEVNWPGIIMGFITLAVGCGVLAMHYYLAESIPVALAVFFILGGVLVFFTGLASVPVIKVFVIPLLFGGIMVTIPFEFCKIIAGEDVFAYTFASAYNFFSSFNVMYCAAFFLAAIGGLAAISAFTELVKYIKYGEE